VKGSLAVTFSSAWGAEGGESPAPEQPIRPAPRKTPSAAADKTRMARTSAKEQEKTNRGEPGNHPSCAAFTNPTASTPAPRAAYSARAGSPAARGRGFSFAVGNSSTLILPARRPIN